MVGAGSCRPQPNRRKNRTETTRIEAYPCGDHPTVSKQPKHGTMHQIEIIELQKPGAIGNHHPTQSPRRRKKRRNV